MSAKGTGAAQRPAGIVTRLIACVIDGLIIGLMLVGAYLGWAFVKLVVDPRAFSWPNGRLLLSMTIALVTAVVYFTFFWMTSGRTVGGALLGIRVTGLNRQVLRFPRALLRAAFCVVFPIGLFWVVINRHRRSIQDIVLRTEVVYDWTTALVPIPPIAVPDAPVVAGPAPIAAHTAGVQARMDPTPIEPPGSLTADS